PGSAARNSCKIELVLREGRKRQVRLMLAAVGHPVRRLIRTAIGPVTLGTLKPGQFRLLAPGEVLALIEDASTTGGRTSGLPSKTTPSQPARKNRPSPDRPAAARKPMVGPNPVTARGSGQEKP